jgi:alkylhydroperoxidase family enzyme
MSRIAPLSPPFPDHIQQHFDRVMPPGAAPLVLFTTIATSERAWAKFRGGSLLDHGPLTLRQREIVINRTCARAGCEYEWGVHVSAFAAAARLTQEQVEATVTGCSSSACWNAEEAVLLATVDALHDRATLTAAEYQALTDHFNEEQILEILLLAGFYRTVSYISNGLNLPLEASAARFPALRAER